MTILVETARSGTRTHCRSDVQAVSFFIGDPVFVYTNELLNELDDGVAIKSLHEYQLQYFLAV